MVAIEYIRARSALLDALETLTSHADSLILVGSQAIYLRGPYAGGGPAPYTTDADLAIDPVLLATNPDIGNPMHDAGFQAGPNPGHWVNQQDIAIDLMVPEASLPSAGRRSARLDGHDKMTARRTAGLEMSLLSNDPMSIGALDNADRLGFTINVASNAALLVAKLIKLAERRDNPKRLLPKDASDVLRLLRQLDPRIATTELRSAYENPSCTEVVSTSMSFLREDLGSRSSILSDLAVRANAGYEDELVTRTSMVELSRRVCDAFFA